MSAPSFIVTFDGMFMGRRVTGTYELDFDRMTHSNIVQAIIDGQFVDIDRVLALEQVTKTGGIFTEVTDAFAKAVADRLFNERIPVSYNIKCWLHRHHSAGCMSTHGMHQPAPDEPSKAFWEQSDA